MKILLLSFSALFLFANGAKAETFECSFTEPFFNINYDTATQKMLMDHFEGGKRTTRKVEFKIVGPAQFQLVNSKGETLLELTLDFQGSNGMSDTIYPYSAKTTLVSGANGGYGGCTSSLLSAVDGEEK